MVTNSGRSAVRSTLVALAVAATVAVAGALVVQTAGAAAPVAGGVEDEGADCPVSLPGSVPSNSRLPDPFTRIDGTRITSVSDWRCRREEIKQEAEKYVYGSKPVPTDVTGTVSATTISVTVSDNGRSTSFSAGVSLPSGTGPFPAVVVVGGLGADTATIKGAGVAVINYDPLQVGAEGTPRSDKQGAFYDLYGSSSGTGLLMAWAWGVSRIIDVIQQSGGDILTPSIGVTGCSRYGKGAFVIGAFDQRIALTMPIESGTGGVPILRGVPGESGAQPLDSAYTEQPWLGDAFGSYTGDPSGLPVDTHEMVGMVAPRGLFIMDNPHIDWLAARSGSVGALGGAEIYKALGAGDNISYWSDVQDATHCAVRPEWQTPLRQNLAKFLLGTGNDPGVFRISSLKAGDLSQWRDWQTPVLTGGTASSPPASASPTTSPSVPPAVGGCAATYRTVNAWSGGFQGEVTVTAGSSAINGWAVSWSLGSGQAITQVWNGTASTSGSTVTVRNVSWNGTLAANTSTTFGFLATGGTSTPALSCTSS